MNSRSETILCCAFAWMIFGFVGPSVGKPMDAPSSLDATGPLAADDTTGNSGSPIIPQVGFLEKTDDTVKTEKDTNLPNSDAGKGILLPIVSVVDANDSAAKNLNPLVALLPAPAAIDQSGDPAKLPVIATLPIVPTNDEIQPAGQPEIRRSLRDASSRARANSKLANSGDSSEMMDVAEDIVFRPLFRIRPSANSAYSKINLRRKNGSNYRRYNVNGYYRLPYNSVRYNNNRYDYGNDRSSADY